MFDVKIVPVLNKPPFRGHFTGEGEGGPKSDHILRHHRRGDGKKDKTYAENNDTKRQNKTITY